MSQHTPTLREPHTEIIAPGCPIELSVLLDHVSGSAETMRGVEYDEVEGLIIEGHETKIGDQIGRDVKSTAIAEDEVLITAIHEQGTGIVRLKPHHPRSTASVKNLLDTMNSIQRSHLGRL